MTPYIAAIQFVPIEAACPPAAGPSSFLGSTTRAILNA